MTRTHIGDLPLPPPAEWAQRVAPGLAEVLRGSNYAGACVGPSTPLVDAQARAEALAGHLGGEFTVYTQPYCDDLHSVYVQPTSREG
jgi:hypothetical protein